MCQILIYIKVEVMKKKELKPIVLNEEQNEYVDILAGNVVDTDDAYYFGNRMYGGGGFYGRMYFWV